MLSTAPAQTSRGAVLRQVLGLLGGRCQAFEAVSTNGSGSLEVQLLCCSGVLTGTGSRRQAPSPFCLPISVSHWRNLREIVWQWNKQCCYLWKTLYICCFVFVETSPQGKFLERLYVALLDIAIFVSTWGWSILYRQQKYTKAFVPRATGRECIVQLLSFCQTSRF